MESESGKERERGLMFGVVFLLFVLFFPCSAGLSVVGSAIIVGYILIKLVRVIRNRKKLLTFEENNPVSGNEGRMETDFLMANTVERSIGPAKDSNIWLLLWFSELMVLMLGLSDLGSALWYFLQLHVLHITCTPALAFFGTVFEPASVFIVTFISISLFVLLRNSLILQTKRSIKITVLVLLFLCALSWILPLILSIVYLVSGIYGAGRIIDFFFFYFFNFFF
jgi:hypothetical protein